MASSEPTFNQPPEIVAPIQTLRTLTDIEPAQIERQQSTAEVLDSEAIFQAVGVIAGSVKFDSSCKTTVSIGKFEYPLFYIPSKCRAFEALKKEINSTGNPMQRLVVYPKVVHFPKKEQSHQIAFQLVGFDQGRSSAGVSSELQDLEFKISGLWQFIPVCPTPCISVFRNFNQSRLEYIKQAELARKVKFLKASHLPVLWQDALLRPFRFNPKADYDQVHPAFVSIKAKFLPHRNVFGFEALLAPPLEKAPKFLKASKSDKALVQQSAKKSKFSSQKLQTLTKPSGATNKIVAANEDKLGSEASPKILKSKPRPKKTDN